MNAAFCKIVGCQNSLEHASLTSDAFLKGIRGRIFTISKHPLYVWGLANFGNAFFAACHDSHGRQVRHGLHMSETREADEVRQRDSVAAHLLKGCQRHHRKVQPRCVPGQPCFQECAASRKRHACFMEETKSDSESRCKA